MHTETQPSVEPHGVDQRANDGDTFSDVFLWVLKGGSSVVIWAENTTPKASCSYRISHLPFSEYLSLLHTMGCWMEAANYQSGLTWYQLRHCCKSLHGNDQYGWNSIQQKWPFPPARFPLQLLITPLFSAQKPHHWFLFLITGGSIVRLTLPYWFPVKYRAPVGKPSSTQSPEGTAVTRRGYSEINLHSRCLNFIRY